MQLDRAALDKLLSMGDSQLKFIITKLAVDNGLDLSTFNITSTDIASIRSALQNATDADIALAAEQLSQHRRGGGRR